jgi:hypothetical protein
MRRALSGKLTRTLNTSTDYPEIRLKVLEALEELNNRLTELRSTLDDNGYFDQSRLKSSDIYIAVILRLIEHQNLDWVARDLENQLLHLPQYRTELLTAAQREDDATLREILELTEAKKLEVKRLSHNTIRHSGISYEQTLVLFCDGAAKACFTLTNAPPQEAPFRPQPLDPTVLLGSVVDLGEQRKASATLPCAPRCRSSWRSSSGSFRGSNDTLSYRVRRPQTTQG